jgi:Uma2 family endonuclease
VEAIMVETERRVWTEEDLLRLPDDGKRYELVRGELVEVASGYRSSAISGRILGSLSEFARPRNLGELSNSQAGFRLSPGNVRMADAAFVTRARLDALGDLSGFIPGAPDLAVEVVSPSDVWQEVSEKVAEYLAAGSRVVWVAHPFERRVYVYRPGEPVRVLDEGDELSGEDVLPGFTLRVAEIFAGI